MKAWRDLLVLALVVAIALPVELLLLGENWAPGYGPDWLSVASSVVCGSAQ